MKYFCECFTIKKLRNAVTGNITNETIVISQLIENIIIKIPIIVQIEVIICVTLWFKFCDTVSISFVIIDNTSPCVLLSKYFIGNLLILCTKSLRILYVIFCVTVVIVNPCIKENNALTAYSPNNVRSICPIFPKSIPAPPDNLSKIPLKISVVALPKIFGPIIENIVLPTANKITIIIGILYCAK